MNKIFDKGKKILFSQQSSVLSAASIIMLMVVASRVLGLVRQRTLAHFFTANDLSLFFAAFRLPDLIFEVLVFLALAVLIGFFASNLYGFIAPGFSGEHREIIVTLTRILFAAQGFFVLSYVLTAVLESSRRFLIPAVAPLFYNLGIIISTIIFAPKLGLMAPTLGVVVGAAMHFFIQFPLAF